MDLGSKDAQPLISGMGMLVGEYTHSLDPKRRLTIPSGWRQMMGSPEYVYVLPDFNEPCLNVFPPAEMEQRLERLRRHSMADRKVMAFARRLGSASAHLPIDVQGRIRVPDKQLGFAGLTAQIVMIGALNRIQLWSPDRLPAEEAFDQQGLAEAGMHVGF